MTAERLIKRKAVLLGDSRLHFVPVEQAIEPGQGLHYVLRNKWWIVLPEATGAGLGLPKRCLVFYQRKGQHTDAAEVTEGLRETLFPWAENQFLEVAFIRQRFVTDTLVY